MIETHHLKHVVIFIQTILSFVLSRKIKCSDLILFQYFETLTLHYYKIRKFLIKMQKNQLIARFVRLSQGMLHLLSS